MKHNPIINRNIQIGGLALLLLAASACQKVIDFKVPNTTTIPVVEALLYAPDSTCNVHISGTSNVFDVTEPQKFNNALVVISEPQQGSDTFVSDGQGNYRPKFLKPIPGRTYKLWIQLNGKIYTSVSEMPVPVPIDSLTFMEFDGGSGGPRKRPGAVTGLDTMKHAASDKKYRVHIHFTDPAERKVNYRFWIRSGKINDPRITQANSYDFDAQFNRGRPIDFPSFQDELWTGDRVEAELQCFDDGVYNYYRTLEETVNSSTISPANPISNITGGCLGYFGAISTTRKVIELK